MSQIFVARPAEVPLSSLPPFVLWLFLFLFFLSAQSTFHCEALTDVSCPVPPYSARENCVWPLLSLMPHSVCPSFASSAPSATAMNWPNLCWFRDWETLGLVCFICQVGLHKVPCHFVVPPVLAALTSSFLLSIFPSPCGVKIQLFSWPCAFPQSVPTCITHIVPSLPFTVPISQLLVESWTWRPIFIISNYCSWLAHTMDCGRYVFSSQVFCVSITGLSLNSIKFSLIWPDIWGGLSFPFSS